MRGAVGECRPTQREGLSIGGTMGGPTRGGERRAHNSSVHTRRGTSPRARRHRCAVPTIFGHASEHANVQLGYDVAIGTPANRPSQYVPAGKQTVEPHRQPSRAAA
jgi:hypothetical protein